MPVKNLPENYLYRKIAPGVIREDVRQLLSAVVNGFQDRVSELRTLAIQIADIWNPANTIGEPFQVVQVIYQPYEGLQRTCLLDVNTTTPAANDPGLTDWCAAEAGIDVSQIISVGYTTDANRTAESRTLQLLADTIGARLYEPIGATTDEIIANQKRILSSHFARLKIKGTAQSFSLLGRLHGFDDVSFFPLWGRVSPRKPSQIGDPANDPDFQIQPDIVPTPGQVSNFYDPTILNDGDSFTWQSDSLVADSSQVNFIPLGINSLSPFITVAVVGTPVRLPLSGIYFLSGGDNFSIASSDNLPAADGLPSNLVFSAITDSASFNGLPIIVTNSGASVTFTVSYNLSAIKFRTSYFDLNASANVDTYGARFFVPVRPSSDLTLNPSLYAGISGFADLGSGAGVAVDPYRPWSGAGNRIPALPSTEILDLSPLLDAGKRLEGALDDVRPATRFARTVSFGFSLSSTATYAPYIHFDLLGSALAGQANTISGTIATANRPVIPVGVSGSYLGTFIITITSDPGQFGGDGFTYRFQGGQIQLWDSAAYTADNTHPWRAIGCDNGQLIISDVIAGGPGSSNVGGPGFTYRFQGGQIQFWDNTAYIADNTRPWRPLGLLSGAVIFGDPVADSLGSNGYSPGGFGYEYQFAAGDFYLQDPVALSVNPNKPWEAISMVGGQIITGAAQSVTPDSGSASTATGTQFTIGAEYNPSNEDQIHLKFQGQLGITLTGTYTFSTGVYSISVPTTNVNFTITAYWQDLTSEAINPEPSSDNELYAARPEDQLDTTYVYTMQDDSPWLRPLAAGGEVENAQHYLETEDLETFVLPATLIVLDENQIPNAVMGIDSNSNRNYRPFVLTQQSTDITGGRLAIGFGGTIPAFVEVPIATIQSNLVSNPYGTPYSIGLLRDILVASPTSHWTSSRRDDLAGWFHLGEHPIESYLLQDHSNFGLTQAELSSGGFVANYTLSDRLWDTDRGWFLNLRPGTSFSISKDRNLSNNFSLAIWLKVTAGGSSAEQTLLTYGPVKITIGGSGTFAQVYLRQLDLTWKAFGGHLALANQVFTLVSIACQDLTNSNLIPADVCSVVNVASRSGLPVIDGVQLQPGQTVLLIGQTDTTQNGHYITTGDSDAWVQATDDFAINGADVYFDVLSGTANSGLYQVTTGGTIVFGTTPVTIVPVTNYAEISTGTLVAASTVVASGSVDIAEFSPTDLALAVTGVNAPIGLHDLQIWSEFKALADFNAIRLPSLMALSTACAPTFFSSTTGNRYSIQVLTSGYAFPNANAVDYSAEDLRLARRYDFKGEYTGDDSHLLIGYGDQENPAMATIQLGDIGYHIPSHGISVAASTSSNLPGTCAAWLAAYIPGGASVMAKHHIHTNVAGSDSIVLSAASSYWPSEVEAQNPIQERLYLIGDDDHPYEITVLDLPTSASLLATRIFRLRGQLLYVSDPVTGIPTQPLTLLPDINELWVQEGFTGAISRVERAGVGIASVKTYLGSPVVYLKTTPTSNNLPPVFLSSNFERRLDLDITADIETPGPNDQPFYWINPTEYGLDNDLAILQSAGQFIFAGNPANLSTNILPAGNYRITIDASNYGALDPEFLGFNLEITLDSSVAALGTILPNGDGNFQLRYRDGANEVTTRQMPMNVAINGADNDVGQSLQTVLAVLDDITGSGLLVLSNPTYPSQPGGPYYVQFIEQGARSLLESNSTTGWSVEVQRLVTGDDVGTQEIQKIILHRPTYSFNVVLPQASSIGWKTSIYWNNSISGLAPGLARQLCLHSLKVERVAAKVFQIDLLSGGLGINQVNVAGLTPATGPGGFEIKVAADGTKSYDHESQIISISSIPGDTVNSHTLPVSHGLTGISVYKQDALFVTNPELAPDISDIPLAPVGSTAVYTDTPPDPGPTVEIPVAMFGPITTDVIVVNWTAATVGLGYKVEQSPDGASWTQVASLGDVRTYSASSLSPSTAYYFRVRSFNLTTNSGYSNIINTTTLAPPVVAPTVSFGPVFDDPLEQVAGRTISLLTFFNGTAPITVQWKKAGVNVTTDSRVTVTSGALFMDSRGNNYSALKFSPLQSGDASEYECVLTNTAGTATGVITLGVYAAPHILSLQNNGAGNIPPGMLFIVTAVGNSPLTYQWTKNGSNITASSKFQNVTTSEMFILGFDSSDSGLYAVVITNGSGSVTSASISL